MCVAWPKDRAGCGKRHDNWRQGLRQCKQAGELGWLGAPWWSKSAEANGLLKCKLPFPGAAGYHANLRLLLVRTKDPLPWFPGLSVLHGLAVRALGRSPAPPLIYPRLAEIGPGMGSAESRRSQCLALSASLHSPARSGVQYLPVHHRACGLWAVTLSPLLQLKAIVFRPLTSVPLLPGTKGYLRGIERPGGNIGNGLSILPSDPDCIVLGPR